MRGQTGAHPRMGAVDVVPFVPIRGLTMEDAVEIARRFGTAFAERAGVPVFFYEEAATSEGRRNLADVRRGEYEGMAEKLRDPAWTVDAGPQGFNERSGVTAVGARMPLVAFNVNLGTDDLEMNLVDYRRTPIHRALELVKVEAARYGVPVRECELVGMVPLEALQEVVGYYLQVPGFDASQVIEYHLLPG